MCYLSTDNIYPQISLLLEGKKMIAGVLFPNNKFMCNIDSSSPVTSEASCSLDFQGRQGSNFCIRSVLTPTCREKEKGRVSQGKNVNI